MPEVFNVMKHDLFDVLEQISATSSRNDKKRILEKHKDNLLLKKYFLYAFNDRWIFGIGQKSIKKYAALQVAAAASASVEQKPLFGMASRKSFKHIFDLLDDLKEHPYGSGADVSAVNNFLAGCDSQAYYWYVRLILKDLKIGCNVKTVNEIYGDYIPVFETQLAHPYSHFVDKFKLGIPFQIQEKINGFRLVVYHYPDGIIKFFTRNGVELFNFPEIVNAFRSISPHPFPVVYDGEAQASMSFNETQKYMMRHGEKTGIKYNVFDCVPLDQWEAGESKDTLFVRYDHLCEYVPELGIVSVVPDLYRGLDVASIGKLFNYAKSQNWEGIMIKFDMTYIRDRSWRMLKLKEMKEIDLTCISVNPGNPGSDLEGTLGSISVDYNGVSVNVGGGFKRRERDEYWANPETILGKTITVQYFDETQNERGLPSLQFPQFLGVRQDK